MKTAQNMAEITKDIKGNYIIPPIISGDSFYLLITISKTGEDYYIELGDITTPEGTAVDITAKVIECNVREYTGDDKLIDGEATHLVAASGTAYFRFTPTMTGTTLGPGVYNLEVIYNHSATIIKRIITKLIII